MSSDLKVSERSSTTPVSKHGGDKTDGVAAPGARTRAIASQAEGFDAQMALLQPVQQKRDPSGGGALAAGGSGGGEVEQAGIKGGEAKGQATDTPVTEDKGSGKVTGGRTLDELASQLPKIAVAQSSVLRQMGTFLQSSYTDVAIARWIFDDALGALVGKGMSLLAKGNDTKIIQVDRFRQLLQNSAWANRYGDGLSGNVSAAAIDAHTEKQLAKESAKLNRVKGLLKAADKAMGVAGVVGGALNVANGLDAYNNGSSYVDKANAVTTMVQGGAGVAAGLMAIVGASLAAPVGMVAAALQLRSRGAEVMKAWKGVEAFGLGAGFASDGSLGGVITGTFVTALGLFVETVVGAVATIGDIGQLLGAAGMGIYDLLCKIFGEHAPEAPPDEPGLPPEVLAPQRPEDAGPAPTSDPGPRQDGYHDRERKLPRVGR